MTRIKKQEKNDQPARRGNTATMRAVKSDRSRLSVIQEDDPPRIKRRSDGPPESITPEATRYSDKELTEFKELILNKKRDAQKELDYLNELIINPAEGEGIIVAITSLDKEEQDEQLRFKMLAQRQIDFIEHLDKALLRIENRTYGICRVTGKLINKARLRAVPHATLCVEAKLCNN